MSKIAYEVNGEVVANLKEVATLLGVDKVGKKDITDGGQYADVVSIVDVAEAGADVQVDEDIVAEHSADEDVADDNGDDWEEGYPQGTADTVNADDIDVTPEEILESMPQFEDVDEFKDFYRDLDTPTAEYIAKGLGLEWKPTDHDNIHRMRISMAMQRHFFPELFQPKEKKKKAKYGDYSTDQLFSLADEHKLKVKKSGNEPIDRMRVIMALKQEGALVE